MCIHKCAGSLWRWARVVYIICLLCLLVVAGQVWRQWQFERRGLERVTEAHVDSRAGLRAGVNVELTQYDALQLDRVLSDIRALGFHWVRQRFSWEAIELSPGSYDWTRWDALVHAVQAHQLDLIVVLDTAPEWARSGTSIPGSEAFPLPCRPPADPEAYARFASALAARYAEQVDYYQVWDEPNLSRSWGGGHVHPCGYVALLEAAYGAIHTADAEAWVLGGGLAPTQAPGPDNLSDLVYLRGMYAAGGKPYFDILAAKPYGFWSGPQDRRVEEDVLNFSRMVGLREVMRAHGDREKPVWAVEWGWSVLPAGWEEEPSPWGSDELSVQQPRILNAIDRARDEWPWLQMMCWAAYHPDVADSSPVWGLALRTQDGTETPLYATLATATQRLSIPPRGPGVWPTGGIWIALGVAGIVDAVLLGWIWMRGRNDDPDVLYAIWNRWKALSSFYHLLALAALFLLYAFTPAWEWILVELALIAAICYLHPSWPLIAAVFSIPFFYGAKPVGTLRLPPSETLLLLAWMVWAARWIASGRTWRWGWARLVQTWRKAGSVLDVAWVLWLAVGTLALAVSPDMASATHEWRLCILGPTLLYGMLRLRGLEVKQSHGEPTGHTGQALFRWILVAWVASGVAVALVGVAQWLVGAWVETGQVGRVTGVYFSPNHMALYLERVWPVVLALAVELVRWRGRMAGAAILLGTGLYLTYSRGAWLLAVPVMILSMGLFYWHRLRWWITGGGMAMISLAMASVLRGRAMPLAAVAGEMRIPVWQSTLGMIADHLWRGVGLDGFQFVYPRYMRIEAWTEPLLYHPHNAWLDAAVRLGLPGLAVYALLIAGSVYAAARLFVLTREVNAVAQTPERSAFWRAVAVGCLASILAGVAHGLVDSGYFLADLAWSLALVAGLLCAGRLAQRRA